MLSFWQLFFTCILFIRNANRCGLCSKEKNQEKPVKDSPMIRDYSEWGIFYQVDVKGLKAHFAAGGSIDDLNGKFGDSALYNCINEDTGCFDYDRESCLSVMLDHGAAPGYREWDLIFQLDRCWNLELLLDRGFTPPPLDLHTIKQGCEKVLATHYCRQATMCCFCIAKTSRQPMSHMWKIIGRHVWQTRRTSQTLWAAIVQHK